MCTHLVDCGVGVARGDDVEAEHGPNGRAGCQGRSGWSGVPTVEARERKRVFSSSTTSRTPRSFTPSPIVVACNVDRPMVPSTSTAEPSLPSLGAPFTRSDSIASSVQSASLRRRSRTRTRSLAPSKRGRSQGHSAGSKYESDTCESFLDFDDAPPVPTVVHDEPEEMNVEEKRRAKQARRRSRTVGPDSRPETGALRPEMPQMSRARSAVDVREIPFEQVRGRQTKSDTGSTKAVRSSCFGAVLC